MKRIIITVVILAVTLTAATLELSYISSQADSFIDRIEIIDKLAKNENFKEAEAECKKMEEEWNKGLNTVNVMLIHDYMDEIGLNISHMKIYLENGDASMYFAESTGAKKRLASIKESEFPYLENIL